MGKFSFTGLKKYILFLVLSFPVIFLFQNCSGEFSESQSIGLNSTSSLNENIVPGSSESTNSNLNADDFKFKSITTNERTVNNAIIHFEVSDFAKAIIVYHTDEKALLEAVSFYRPGQKPLTSKGEHSFKYKSHQQTLSSLAAGTVYYFKIFALNSKNEEIQSTVQQFKTNTDEINQQEVPKRPLLSEASTLWTNQGYTLFFSSTPNESDIGNDPKNYFQSKWSNGYSLLRYIAKDNLKITKAPDGSPAAHISYKPGEFQTAASIVGNQFGPKGPEAQVVYSLETYFECIDGKNPKLYQYMGHGHHWASEDNVNAMPGGSNNREDSWSLRVPISKSGYYFTYAYIPDKQVTYGRSFIAIEPKPTCGRWEKMEVEIIQNTPVTKKNGIIRMYLNEKLIMEAKNLQIRTKPTVRPKGLGYFVQQQNQNSKDLNIYTKNWKIYTK